MKRNLLFIIGLTALLLGTYSCVSTPPPPPKVQTTFAENDNIKLGANLASYEWCSNNPNAGFATKYQFAFNGLSVYIQNKTDKIIEIDWNRSSYLYNGQTNSGFMYEGVKYSERSELNRRPDFIMPNMSFQKTVYPNFLAEWVPPYNGVGGGWVNKCISTTVKSGVLIVYKIEGKEYYLQVEM